MDYATLVMAWYKKFSLKRGNEDELYWVSNLSNH